MYQGVSISTLEECQYTRGYQYTRGVSIYQGVSISTLEGCQYTRGYQYRGVSISWGVSTSGWRY